MQTLDFLEELIRFPSVSTESNGQITDCLQNWLKSGEFECERISYVDDRGVSKSCLAARKGPKSGQGMAYFCHTDVVPVDSWSFPDSGPWTPKVLNGRVYGRGSCDMRGSAACMLAAAQSFPASRLKKPLYFIATADEEIGFAGAKAIVNSSTLYRDIVTSQSRAVVGEPTCLEVVHAHKGGRAIRVTSTGRAAHSSTGLGLNANMALIPFLQEVARLNEEMETQATWRDERFAPPTPTLNLMILDTNSAINITSARSECTVYFRPMPGQNADLAVRRLQSIAATQGLKFDDLFCGSPVYTDPDSDFIQDLLQLTGRARSRTVSYGTDGAVFTELKNLAVFGPGDIAQAHTDDEWISLEQLKSGTELFARCLEHWCC